MDGALTIPWAHIAHYIVLLGAVGMVYRTWVRPARDERVALAKWRTEQEATDAAHTTRMDRIEERLTRGEDRFANLDQKLDRILEAVAQLSERLARLEASVEAHRRAQE